MTVLVVQYADLELYPPALNAVIELAKRFQRIDVVQRSLGHGCVDFPANVTIESPVKITGQEALQSATFSDKLMHFRKFIAGVRSAYNLGHPRLVLAFDPIALMAVRLAGIRKSDSVLWYHNHDFEEQNPNRFLSLGWLAYESQSSGFKAIDFFTLPARERLYLFPVQKHATNHFVIPNYPSLDRVREGPSESPANEIRLVYQGSLGRHHGFCKIIPWLGRKIGGKTLRLSLVGKIDDHYRKELVEISEACGLREQLEFIEFVPFSELQSVLERFHIGLAIHEPVGVTYSTGGSASNKIYEYAAAGLPVLLFDSPHYREYLTRYRWTAFCNLTWDAFSESLQSLLNDYEGRSGAAVADITERLNYQAVFAQAWERLCPNLSIQDKQPA